MNKFGVGAAGGRRLLVSVESPAGLHTLAVPLDSRVEDLIPALVQACEGPTDASGWMLAPKGEAPLDGSRTIRECGLFRGAVLVLSAPDVEPAVPAPAATSPGADGFPTTATPDLAGRLTARLRSPPPGAAPTPPRRRWMPDARDPGPGRKAQGSAPFARAGRRHRPGG